MDVHHTGLSYGSLLDSLARIVWAAIAIHIVNHSDLEDSCLESCVPARASFSKLCKHESVRELQVLRYRAKAVLYLFLFLSASRDD